MAEKQVGLHHDFRQSSLNIDQIRLGIHSQKSYINIFPYQATVHHKATPFTHNTTSTTTVGNFFSQISKAACFWYGLPEPGLASAQHVVTYYFVS